MDGSILLLHVVLSRYRMAGPHRRGARRDFRGRGPARIQYPASARRCGFVLICSGNRIDLCIRSLDQESPSLRSHRQRRGDHLARRHESLAGASRRRVSESGIERRVDRDRAPFCGVRPFRSSNGRPWQAHGHTMVRPMRFPVHRFVECPGREFRCILYSSRVAGGRPFGADSRQ